MSRNPLGILKRGFAEFLGKIKDRKNKLDEKLSRGEAISPSDEQWLDNEGNAVDEHRILEVLESAPDYERAVAELDNNGKAIVSKLREWAGASTKVAGNKRKRPDPEKEKDLEKRNKKKTTPSAPIFTKKENATLAQRIEILDWHHGSGGNQSATARHFGPLYPNLQIKQPLISSWLRDEVKWRKQWQESDHQSDRVAKRTRQTEHPEVSEMMDLWVSKAMADGILLTGEVLRQKWIAFANLTGVPEDERIKLSNGWLAHFKGRNGLREIKRHGEAASAKPETVEHERRRIQDLIQEAGYKPRDIYNMDETGLFYGMVPEKGLSDRRQAGVKKKKNRLTYMFTVNASGSEKLPAFIIGKAARPRAFQKKSGAQLGFHYRSNPTAWMTAQLYQDWIRQWDRELQVKNRKVLLLQDNFSGHIVPPDLRNIRVENFVANLTSHVQPLDQGIIQCFKAHYRAQFFRRAVNQYDDGITPANIYDINQLEAMRMAESAWHSVDTTTIQNCWEKAGILPETGAFSAHLAKPSIPISTLLHSSATQTDPISQIESALDDLVSRGALQKANRMDIGSLLNPAGESYVLTEATDVDIYQAVMDAVEARENIDKNGGDDVDEDGPIKPCPARGDILQATPTISECLPYQNDPLARQLETLLGAFTRKLRIDETMNMKDTLLTDFYRIRSTDSD